MINRKMVFNLQFSDKQLKQCISLSKGKKEGLFSNIGISKKFRYYKILLLDKEQYILI
jgi:hypothetical protein